MGELEETRVDVSPTPLRRDDLLADSTNGVDLKGRWELVTGPTRPLYGA